MLLAIDVGNTETVIGLLDGIEVEHHWRVATVDSRTTDEIMALLRGLFVGVDAEVDGVAICSTVPVVQREMRRLTQRYYGDVPSLLVEPGVKTGVPILTDNPREVGTDRIVNALAAMHRYGAGPHIVVDFGTATTFDVVSARGEYLGGAIAPGIDVSLEALRNAAAQLRRVELVRPRSVIARNTVEALQSGALYGFSSQVDGIVTRMAAELGVGLDGVTVIATGGLAPLVLDESATIHHHEPWLTLMGLRLVFDRNHPA
ncbi:type III pantothenate kinase [Jiangella asiatica]|uniref:Type III pantothenate kinase n=1 Tax=Jiangella asiatica TaxID=2530372 RepID=A0A4R5D623_9ACTN|nr:type III pantothenate kinase [Jiangella asiatica]TDE08889.1 type III pantothenate kinase [Jiangella asiatica]